MCVVSCEKLVEVAPPVTSTNGENVFEYTSTTISAVTGLYAAMSSATFSAVGDIRTINVYAGLYTDELSLFPSPNVNRIYQDFFTNSLSAQKGGNGGQYWNLMYARIYRCNALLVGINNSINIPDGIKKQLIGEVLFVRSLCYYYLLNFYGNIPWIDGIDYTINSHVKRNNSTEILKYLVADLTKAKDSLSLNYLDASLLKTVNNARFRPTSYAASALLIKVLLLQEDWINAELEANRVISNSQVFSLDSLNAVFLTTSKEAIWQLQVTSSNGATEEGNKFILPTTGASESAPLFLNPRLVAAFEKNDRRKQAWIGTARSYNYAFKYKVANSVGSPSEALVVFRLSEVYLNRSEARARQGKIDLSLNDLNQVRSRAWLGKVMGVAQDKLIDTILHERQVELFTEFGNRFIDLKRFNKIDLIMPSVSIDKGTTWQPYFSFFPLAQSEVQANPNIEQTPGY